jgi:hypothetical protein
MLENGNEDYELLLPWNSNLVSYSIVLLFGICNVRFYGNWPIVNNNFLASHSLGIHLIETNGFVESEDQKRRVCRDFGMKKTLIRDQLQLKNSENKELRPKRNRENNNLEVLQVLFGHQLGSQKFWSKKKPDSNKKQSSGRLFFDCHMPASTSTVDNS